MNQRVLLVDDDATLLSSLRRNLQFDYDITTAESGHDALALMASKEPFSLIVTDMRMPSMDGIQFIDEARHLQPDAVYIMLTGNQDIQTAMKAVNDGQVFRFLNKPCEIAEIRRAFNAGLQQHQLIHAEKELLQNTFVGAVNMLTDVLGALRPDILEQSHRIDAVMKVCEEAVGFCGNWQNRMTARLALVGLALQPPVEQSRFQHLNLAEPASAQLFDAVTATTTRLIERIPRLGPVVDVLQSPIATEGEITRSTDETKVGATLLRIATHWAIQIASGASPIATLAELRRAFPKLPTVLAETLLTLEADRGEEVPISIAMYDLVDGMVLCEDVVSMDGVVLLRSGRQLTGAIIEKLRLHSLNVSSQIPNFLVTFSGKLTTGKATHAGSVPQCATV